MRNEKIAVPEAIEKLLGEMNFLSQFHALRELHAIIHDQGESSALIGALSRAYANLGVMTEFHWHPAHTVLKARSMLYAQRLVARDDKSPVGKWHRAYASALVGLPNGAEADLKEANEAWRAMASKDRPPKPAWLPLVGPFCRYQIAALDEQARDPKISQLAAMLKFLAVDQAGGKIWAVQTAIQTLGTIPECYRVSDSLCEFAGVSTLHQGTLLPIKLLGEELYARLESMPGLPQQVHGIIKQRLASNDGGAAEGFASNYSSFTAEFKARRQLVETLINTGKPPAVKAEDTDHASTVPARGEPSWAALGLLLRELSFMQVYRRASFERHCLDVPTEDWLAAAAPLVENHPYKALLETYAWDNSKAKEAAARLANVDVTGLEENAYRFYYAFPSDDPTCEKVGKETCQNKDYTVRDFVNLVRLTQQEKTHAVPFAKALLEISPRSPLARALLVQHNWEGLPANAAEWDKNSAPYPHLASMFGERYTKLGRWDDAERCFKAAIKVVPGNPDYYRQLAQVYKLRGQTDRWLATLEEYLQQPDYSLAHFNVKSEIAYHFMKQKEWEKALPYAEGAAECYSCWGLCCAAECYEGLQRWAKAEQFYRAASERYRSNSLSWYFFCYRTGKGDLKAAQQHARVFVANLAAMPGEPDLYDLTTFYLLEQEPKQALRTLEQALVKKPNPFDALWLAMIAEQLNDVRARELALNRVKSLSTTTGNEATSSPDWANALSDFIAKDRAQARKGRIDFDAADKFSAPLEGYGRSWFHYLLGQYLHLHSQRDAAHRYWKQCMGWTGIPNDQRTLAGAMLLKDNVKAAEYKALLQPGPAQSEKPKQDKR